MRSWAHDTESERVGLEVMASYAQYGWLCTYTESLVGDSYVLNSTPRVSTEDLYRFLSDKKWEVEAGDVSAPIDKALLRIKLRRVVMMRNNKLVELLNDLVTDTTCKVPKFDETIFDESAKRALEKSVLKYWGVLKALFKNYGFAYIVDKSKLSCATPEENQLLLEWLRK
jgi:hypothetical protein